MYTYIRLDTYRNFNHKNNIHIAVVVPSSRSKRHTRKAIQVNFASKIFH